MRWRNKLFDFNKNKVKTVIENLNKGKVLVIGDFAIDEMIYGQTHRISREAPVLILKHTNTKIILGAASNAVHNISALNGGKAAALGVYGDDYHGPILLETLENAGVSVDLMVMDTERVTTTKTRISGYSVQSVNQQIVRIDREINDPLSKETEAKVIEKIKNVISDYDGVILSDYKIGMMTPAIIETTINEAKKYNIPVAVDTQDRLDRFKGATVLTPNQPDAEGFVGYQIKDEKTLLKAGQDLLDKTDAEMILLTRGGDGMALFEKNGKVSHIPAFNKTDVFDVTGAGDTVVASFILGLCAGATPCEAAIVGNLAASLVIRHFGCATTSIEELLENLDKLNTTNYCISK